MARKRRELEFTLENKIKALDDIWTFADLIRFEGMRPFGDIHEELADVVTAPQRNGAAHLSHTVRISEGKPVDPVLMKERHRLILMPRGHLKSTIGTRLYVLWRIYRNPNIRITVCVNKEQLGVKFLKSIKAYFEDEELQEKLWNKRPHVRGRLIPVMDRSGKKRRDVDDTEAADKKVVWNRYALQVLRDLKSSDPTLQVASRGASATGSHVDLLIQDDVVDDKNSSTPEQIEATNDWVSDMEFVLDPQEVQTIGTGKYKLTEVVGDEILRIGTRYALGDLYEWTEKEAEALYFSTFIRNIYHNGSDATDGYLWPERFNDYEVNKRRKACRTAKRFASQYLNQIIASEDKAFSWEQIEWVASTNCKRLSTGVKVVTGEPDERTGIAPGKLVKPVIVIDPAMGLSTGDDTAILVGGKDDEGKLYAFDGFVGKHGPAKTAELMYDLVEKWGVKIVHVECVGYQRSLITTCKEHRLKFRRPAVCFREYFPKGNKEMRITNHLQPLCENGLLVLAKKFQYMENIRNFFDLFPSPNVHDDFGDALAVLDEVTLTLKQQEARRPRKGQNSRTPYAVNRRYGGIR